MLTYEYHPGGTGPPRWQSDKEPTCQHRRYKRHKFNPWVRKIPWKGGGNLLQYPCLENPMDRGQQSMESQESDMTKRLNYHHCEGCCIPSKGFLPTVVDTMVI